MESTASMRRMSQKNLNRLVIPEAGRLGQGILYMRYQNENNDNLKATVNAGRSTRSITEASAMYKWKTKKSGLSTV